VCWTHPHPGNLSVSNSLQIHNLFRSWFGVPLALLGSVLEPGRADIAGGVMTARKMFLLTLVFLLPCGFLILLTRSVLRSSLGERFLKGATTTRKLAFLALAVLSVAGLAAGCGRGSQTAQQPLAPRWVSLTIRNNGLGSTSLVDRWKFVNHAVQRARPEAIENSTVVPAPHRQN
jgi:hypothetical protein